MNGLSLVLHLFLRKYFSTKAVSAVDVQDFKIENMKLSPLLFYCITSASIALHAQSVIAYSHDENLYKSTGSPPGETAKIFAEKPIKNKMDQTRIHASPIGNFLNLNHQYSKNSFYQIFNDKGVPFLAGRLTANGVIKVKSLSKGIYQLQINNKPILWFVKQ